jgi:hypothetical protein
MLKGLGIPDDPKTEDHTITMRALVAKRADILFDIKQAEKLIEQRRADLIHLDAVLRLLRPDFKEAGLPIRHRRPVKSPYFKHGEITERIYDALRAGDAVTNLEIAAAAMREKGLDPDNDPITRTDFIRRFRLQLNVLHRAGQLERATEGKMRRWKLASGA